MAAAPSASAICQELTTKRTCREASGISFNCGSSGNRSSITSISYSSSNKFSNSKCSNNNKFSNNSKCNNNNNNNKFRSRLNP